MPVNTKIHSGGLADNAVSTAKIAGDAVTNPKVADDAVGIAELAAATGITDKYHKVPAFADDAARNTAISSPTVGMLVYNTDKGVVQQYNVQGWASIDSPPTVSSLNYPGDDTALDIVGEFSLASSSTTNTDATITVSSTTNLKIGMLVTGTGIPAAATVLSITNSTTFELSANATATGTVTLTFNTQTLIITGTNFQTGVTVTIDGTAPSTVARNSSTQITVTGTPAKTAGTKADGLVVTNPTGLAASINVDYSALPTWTTASGNLLTAYPSTISTIDLNGGATATSYAIASGQLPTGLSMNTTTGDITGTMSGTAQTYNFTVDAIDAESQSTPRLFNIILSALPTGGTIIEAASYTGDYRSHTFLSSGSFVVSATTSVDILIIGGGGGGGANPKNDQGTGGGGSGGLLHLTSQSWAAGTYTITVGAGGIGATVWGVLSTTNYGNGYNSTVTKSGFTTITAVGGGHGAVRNEGDGGDGGSGGGSVISWDPGHGTYSGSAGVQDGTSLSLNQTVRQGYDGGLESNYAGGGGGGYSGVGADADESSVDSTTGGVGGAGIQKNIRDGSTNVWYAAGGGGGSGGSSTPEGAFGGGGGGPVSAHGAGQGGGSRTSSGNSDGVDATANTGSGGGGSGGYNNGTTTATRGNGGDGGSGIVIIRYAV